MTHCLITGASSGIGEGLARYVSNLGWSVTLAARREEKLERIAEQLASQSFVRPTDVSDLDGLASLVAEAEAALGPIDVLVNNAGVQFVEPTVGVSIERIQRLLDVDLTAPLALIHEVAPGMLARGQGTTSVRV